PVRQIWTSIVPASKRSAQRSASGFSVSGTSLMDGAETACPPWWPTSPAISLARRLSNETTTSPLSPPAITPCPAASRARPRHDVAGPEHRVPARQPAEVGVGIAVERPVLRDARHRLRDAADRADDERRAHLLDLAGDRHGPAVLDPGVLEAKADQPVVLDDQADRDLLWKQVVSVLTI